MKPFGFSAGALGILAAVAAVGCSDHSRTTAPALLQPEVGLMASGSSRYDDYPRATLVFADEINVNGTLEPAGIRGDGRLKDGTTAAGSPSNEYQGRFCGFAAIIYNGSKDAGDLKFDSDAEYSSTMAGSCGAARYFNFYLKGPGAAPTVAWPMSISSSIWRLGPGQWHSIPEGFGPVGPCGNVQFNDAYPPSNNVRVTRLADAQTQSATGPTIFARRWLIESQGSHRAACLTYSKNGTPQYSDVTYYLPFAITVTEVPYPYPSFP